MASAAAAAAIPDLRDLAKVDLRFATTSTPQTGGMAPTTAGNKHMQLVHFVVGTPAPVPTATALVTNSAQTTSSSSSTGPMSVRVGNAKKKRSIPAPPTPTSKPPSSLHTLSSSSYSSKTKKIDSTCTICGQHYDDKAAFNSHIKAHLKEKLNIKRQQRQQQQQQLEQRATETAVTQGSPAKAIKMTTATTSVAAAGIRQEDTKKVLQQQQQLPRKRRYPPPPPSSSMRPPPPPQTSQPPPPTLQPPAPPSLLTSHSQLMAELAACKPVPPPKLIPQIASLQPLPPPSPLHQPPQQQQPQLPPPPPSQPPPPPPPLPSLSAISANCTPEISDMEDDLMSYEMEMNRIDFHNDLSSILDQIEKDFESPDGCSIASMQDIVHNSMVVDTPPDSDSDNNNNNSGTAFNGNSLLTLSASPISQVQHQAFLDEQQLASHFASLEPTTDLLGLDRFAKRIPDGLLLAAAPVGAEATGGGPASASVTQQQQHQPHPAAVEGQKQGVLLSTAGDTLPRSQGDTTPDNKKGRELQHQTRSNFLHPAPNSNSNNPRLVQSPASLAKVGPLPAKALAVLSQLPSKIFSSSGTVNVVKVDHGGGGGGGGNMRPAAAAASGNSFTVINIECHQPGKNGEIERKVIETYRAIDMGNEIKLMGGGGMNTGFQQLSPPPSSLSSGSLKSPMSSSNEESSAETEQSTCCGVCGKFVPVKAMPRHMEKHSSQSNSSSKKSSFSSGNVSSGKFRCVGCGAGFREQWRLSKHRRSHPECGISLCQVVDKYVCGTCGRGFSQRGHLLRHEKSTHGSNLDLVCRICLKQCKNRVSLVRHRARHLACMHCSTVFENKVSLQEHLLKTHPESAIITVEKPSTSSSSAPSPSSPSSASESSSASASSTTSSLSSGCASSKSDTFLIGRCHDDEEDSPAANAVDNGLSPDAIGESLAQISNANFFDFAKDLNDEFYAPPADLF